MRSVKLLKFAPDPSRLGSLCGKLISIAYQGGAIISHEQMASVL